MLKKNFMNEYYELRKENYLISTDSSKLNVDVIHHFLSEESYWAKGITRRIVERAIANSICFGVYNKQEQIGFARVITDKATFGYVADVFILTQHRGKGLGKWLMETIHTHSQLQGFRRWLLLTKDAHGLYEQFRWARLNDDIAKRCMIIHNPEVYKRNTTVDTEAAKIVV